MTAFGIIGRTRDPDVLVAEDSGSEGGERASIASYVEAASRTTGLAMTVHNFYLTEAEVADIVLNPDRHFEVLVIKFATLPEVAR